MGSKSADAVRVGDRIQWIAADEGVAAVVEREETPRPYGLRIDLRIVYVDRSGNAATEWLTFNRDALVRMWES